ncbi:MAG: long-chain fatty acid--CoA ligase [Elusimicrobiota bacterium]
MLLGKMLEETVKEYPSKVALFFKGKEITYQQLNEQIDFLALALRALGIKKGDKAGIYLRNCPEFVVYYFALAKIGAVAVPINFLLKPDEIKYIFNDSQTVMVLTSPVYLDTIHKVKPELPKLRHIVITGDQEQKDTLLLEKLIKATLKGCPTEEEEQTTTKNVGQGFSLADKELSDDETVTIIYTSGTTGKPKGAMLTHKNFYANIRSCQQATEVTAKDNFLCLLPMFHSFAWTACVLLPLNIGSKIVIIESIQPFGPILKAILKQHIHIFVAIPPVFAALLRLPFVWPMRFINPIRLCVSGAAALPREVLEKFQHKFHIPLLEGYGLTEASPVVSLNPLKGEDKPGSVGLPLPGVEVKIVDDEGKTLPVGEVGEICARGDNVMKGYYGLPKETAEALHDGWLFTGDFARIDQQGYIYIVDRKKDLVIVKGLNVYPKEVEDVILQNEKVSEAAVVGIPDETGDEIIKVYLVMKEGQTVAKSEILQLCREKLAAYKIPKHVEFLPELPKNALGKVLKNELRGKG